MLNSKQNNNDLYFLKIYLTITFGEFLSIFIKITAKDTYHFDGLTFYRKNHITHPFLSVIEMHFEFEFIGCVSLFSSCHANNGIRHLIKFHLRKKD